MFAARYAARFRSLVGLSALLLAGCAGGPPEGNVLRVGLQDDPKSLDPAIAYDVPTWGAEHLVYNGLVTYDFSSRVAPDLASTWQVAPDKKRYVFHLRPGLRFSNGRPLVAADVVYSFDRLMDPATRSPGASFYSGIVGAKARLAGHAPHLTGVTAVDAGTVAIALEAPDAVFLQLLAMPFASVVPAGAGSELARHPLGSGPFRLKDWKSGRFVSFERNPYHRAPHAPRLDGVTYVLGVSENLEVLKYERGEIDLLGPNRNIPAAEFGRLIQDPRYRPLMRQAPDAAFHYVGMNCQVPPFDNPWVRQAIACAIDKQRIVQLVNGRGQVARGILPPSMPGYDARLRGYPYDPQRSRALLARAGFPQGFAVTYYCVSSTSGTKLAASIQQDLTAVGLRVTLKPLAFPTFLAAKATAGRVGIASGNWTQDFPDPSNFLTTMFHSKNIKPTDSLNDSFYRNGAVDRLLDRAGAQTDLARRGRLFTQAEALIVHDAPVVPLYYPVKYQLLAKRLKHYRMHPIWAMDLADVSLEGPR